MSKASSKIARYRIDPVFAVRDLFGVEPDDWQADVLVAFVSRDLDKVRILMKACAGPGKSTAMAWCIWIFMLCFADKGNHPKGIAVSISFDNLKTGLWSELSHWQKKSKLLEHCFTWTQTKIFAKDHPETWCFYARSFPQSADTETIGRTLSGVHAKYLMYAIDESGAIPAAIAKTAEQGLGETLAREGGFAKLMTAGNPIATDGLLYNAATSENWFKVTITSDPLDPKRTPRVSKEWAQDQIDKYGRDDPWVMAYILGQFPTSAINTLLSLDEVEKAMAKHLTVEDYAYSQKRLGVDVARQGLDATVIFPRQGLRAFKYTMMRNAEGPDIAARVSNAKAKWGSEMEFVDDTGGFGSSVIDSLRMGGHNPQGIHFSSKAIDERFYNKRAEMWFKMAEWVKRGGALPSCERLKKELCAPTYSFKNGKLILEDKDQIKKRLGYSPDVADALALTFALDDMPATDKYEYLRKLNDDHGKIQSSYDPFKEI